MPKYIVGLDIGSENICATMSTENENKEFEVLNFVCKITEGVKKGKIIDPALVMNNVKLCLQELENVTGNNIEGIYLGIGSENCRIVSSKGYVYLEDDLSISERHIQNAYLNGKNITVNEDEYIVDGIVNFFYIEEQGFIKNPLGLKANKLEIDLDLVISKKNIISSLKSVVLGAGYEVKGMTLSIDSLKNIFLSDSTLLNNVALINVGAEKTEIALYKCNQLKEIGFIPLGGKNISKDLSICLSIDEQLGERLKLECSNEYISMVDESIINLGNKEVDSKFIYEIMDARLTEIIEYIHREIQNSGFYDEIDLLFIAGDGISYFENIHDKVKKDTDKKVKVFTKSNLNLNNSSIITSISIVKEVYDRLKLIRNEKVLLDTRIIEDEIEETNNKKIKKRGLARVKAFFDEIF